jgi:antitoxin component of MazEF toxin-antitoxin module
MKIYSKIGKSGNSLSCRISKALAVELDIHEGTEVVIESSDNGFTVVLAKPKTKASLPFTEKELVESLSPKKAYMDLLE